MYRWHLGFHPSEGEEQNEMFFRVVCHFSPFLLSAGRQKDTGRRTSKEAGRQAGRGRLMLQRGRLQYVGECASILTWGRKSSLPSGAFLPFADLHNSLFSSLWREGLLSQQPSIVRDEFVGPGDFTHPSVVTEVSHLVSVSVCGLHVPPDAESLQEPLSAASQAVSEAIHKLKQVWKMKLQHFIHWILIRPYK